MENITNSAFKTVDWNRQIPALNGLYCIPALIIIFNLPAAIIVTLFLKRRRREKDVVILLSLSITDLLFGILLFFNIALSLKTYVEYSTCLAGHYLMTTSLLASLIHLFCISFERICCICFKLASVKANRKFVTCILVAGTWLIAICVVVSQPVKENIVGDNTCTVRRVMSTGFPIYATALAIFQLGIVINVLLLMITLVKHKNYMEENGVRTISTRDIRTVITISLVSLATTLTGLPLIAFMLYCSVYGWPSSNIGKSFLIISGLSSLANPIMYIFRVRKFRKIIINSLENLICTKNAVGPNHINVQCTVQPF